MNVYIAAKVDNVSNMQQQNAPDMPRSVGHSILRAALLIAAALFPHCPVCTAEHASLVVAVDCCTEQLYSQLQQSIDRVKAAMRQ